MYNVCGKVGNDEKRKILFYEWNGRCSVDLD